MFQECVRLEYSASCAMHTIFATERAPLKCAAERLPSEVTRSRAEACHEVMYLSGGSATTCRAAVAYYRGTASMMCSVILSCGKDLTSCDVRRNTVAWQLSLHVSHGCLHSNAQGPDARCGLCNGLHVWHREVQVYHSRQHGELLTYPVPWQARKYMATKMCQPGSYI